MFKYAVLFDGGSKGTRMYVYSYKLNNQATSSKKASKIEQKLYCELLGECF